MCEEFVWLHDLGVGVLADPGGEEVGDVLAVAVEELKAVGVAGLNRLAHVDEVHLRKKVVLVLAGVLIVFIN